MRDERGSAPVELVWLTILLLVPFVYVMIAVFDAQRAAYAVSSASKAAARAYVQAPDTVTATLRAQRAAAVALGDQRVRADVEVVCLPAPSSCLQPGSSVRVSVSTVQPLPLTPSVLGDEVGGVAVDSSHVEPYGSFREGR
ncbi:MULTISPECIES: hypothetical protein [unclassified Aeromicrobium]|uniref:hypothetical protein n=1 Tax=unclassified Aeromicrobium TaxID=2633570 RepID=UPI000A921CFD|nr:MULTISPECIES: hypothetical protein [unclassified Aeromicrobium]